MRTNRTAVLSIFGALALTAALFTSPAGATDRDGDADRDAKTSYTEDDDTNDGGTPNNVADDGDNRHPSGRDRSVERGGSGNQGRSESDPDDDGRGPDRSNGGPDKPNGSGGVDLADQDGNNGCGNDDDFEDDNEGWCGNKPDKPEADSTDVGGQSRCEDDMRPGRSCDDDCKKHDGMTAGDDAKTCDHDDECVDADAMTDGDDTEACALALAAKSKVLGLEAIAAVGGGAGADGVDSGMETEVLGLELEAPAEDDGVLASVSAGALAFTGDHILVLMIVALAALALGIVMVRQTRRTRIVA